MLVLYILSCIVKCFSNIFIAEIQQKYNDELFNALNEIREEQTANTTGVQKIVGDYINIYLYSIPFVTHLKVEGFKK